ncbi:MAG: 50S ribosomal protein L18 [Chitinophagales bacterium]|jgi:large subunit ribosomal protein L18|nr:50S ribosomal protein L18 [Chitinophagales bacterium]MCC7058355.1 50S ribosomal protein L18 [Chitinophagales bacterium]MDA0197426.1 50S ribosomal protein L18 [Bacteroidota bacterium]HMS51637.1 50S ribosomal protein L18 [Chitinophagales bacterium]
MAVNKASRRKKIHLKVRKKIQGTSQRPRLAVFRSNKYIYAQLIDDSKGITLGWASSKDPAIVAAGGNKVDQSKKVGALLAERASAAGVTEVVFDRGGFLYHGRIKAIADGAREGGLQF